MQFTYRSASRHLLQQRREGSTNRPRGTDDQSVKRIGQVLQVDQLLDNTAWIDTVRSGAYRDWIAQNYAERA